MDIYEELENWEYLASKMNQEGFHYCFQHYSNWDEIQDKEFHKLRKKYLKSAIMLENYVKNKIESLDEE